MDEIPQRLGAPVSARRLSLARRHGAEAHTNQAWLKLGDPVLPSIQRVRFVRTIFLQNIGQSANKCCRVAAESKSTRRSMATMWTSSKLSACSMNSSDRLNGGLVTMDPCR